MLVSSWNVLADRYMLGDGCYGNYDHVAPELKRWGARIPHILRVIHTMWGRGVAVMAIQEAEIALRAAVVSTGLWQVLWSAKPGREVGQMMLISWRLPLMSYQGCPSQMMQWATVRNDEGMITLANAHIRWAPANSADHSGVNQTIRILRRLGVTSPVAILTDSNDRPGGPVRAKLLQAGFDNVDSEQATAFVNGQPASMDLIAVRGVRARMLDAGLRPMSIPTMQCPSDHIPIVADLTL